MATRLPTIDLAIADDLVPERDLMSPAPSVDLAARSPEIDLEECACSVVVGQLDFRLPRNSGWLGVP
ncbi:MAG: hypothetical protein GWN84_20650 [Gammaproteobacteria bacterium]|nr:hypothetical protein [Gammaproteobacteria bacterium]NIR85172.1 hypothetical protein [Gammaproteobacteria bacterium]NIU06221.1 hypothetical protein [Gammaproteobacteria bacterium]NIX87494.1 hypothetical protein [Gammaproteobacteria bacterium]